MLQYLKESIRRKLARRRTSKYGYEITEYELSSVGKIRYAIWQNPLFDQIPFSEELMNFFRTYIPEGSLAIDIGAHVGDTTIPIALASGPAGLTLGFDPNPYVFEILEVNARLNESKTNIEAFNYAITEEDGKFYFRSSDASFTNGGISDNPDSKRHGGFKLESEIRGINLESFLNESYSAWLPKLSLIKIDAEGHDLAIIKSINSLLTKWHPAIISEVNRHSSTETKGEIYDELTGLGYSLHFNQQVNFDQKIPISVGEEKLTRGTIQKEFTFNFLALYEP